MKRRILLAGVGIGSIMASLPVIASAVTPVPTMKLVQSEIVKTALASVFEEPQVVADMFAETFKRANVYDHVVIQNPNDRSKFDLAFKLTADQPFTHIPLQLNKSAATL